MRKMNSLLQLTCDLQQEGSEEPRARHDTEREKGQEELASPFTRCELLSLLSCCL